MDGDMKNAELDTDSTLSYDSDIQCEESYVKKTQTLPIENDESIIPTIECDISANFPSPIQKDISLSQNEPSESERSFSSSTVGISPEKSYDNIPHVDFKGQNKRRGYMKGRNPNKELKEREKEERKQQREVKRQEKLVKQEQLKREKQLKALIALQERNKKPEESIKFIKVHVDNDLVSSSYGGIILSTLQQAEIQCSVHTQPHVSTITWSREVQDHVIDEENEIVTSSQTEDEDGVVYVLPWQQVVTLIQKEELVLHCELVKSKFGGKNLILVVFGVEKYFAYQKTKKKQKVKSQASGSTLSQNVKSSNFDFENVGTLSRHNFEYAITELQLLCQCNCRLVESSEDLGILILQFTKSLAQAQYKKEKSKGVENLEWFASADSKQCVKVDKNGNGLQRLWLQQLCQFNHAGLETAEAIAAKYPSPTLLVNAYQNCDDITDAEVLLQDIPVRRNAGILSSTRKIGPEMSKKICHFFLTQDPNTEV